MGDQPPGRSTHGALHVQLHAEGSVAARADRAALLGGLRRLSDAGCEFCTFVTPTVYPGMLEFIRRHCAPYASFTGETRGTRKLLTCEARRDSLTLDDRHAI